MNNIASNNVDVDANGVRVDEHSVFPVYKCYPISKPFINDNLQLDLSKPYIPFPETIISALKNLQQKIRQLENEKNDALVTLHEMSLQTNRKRNNEMNMPLPDGKLADKTLNKTTLSELSNLNLKLDSAEQRCKTLDEQLNRMKQTFKEHFQQSQSEMKSFNSDDINPRTSTDILNLGNININDDDETNAERTLGAQNYQRHKRTRLSEEKKRLDSLKKLAEDKVKILEEQLELEKSRCRIIEEKAKEVPQDPPQVDHQHGRKTFLNSGDNDMIDVDVNESGSYTFNRKKMAESDEDINGLLFQLREEYAHLQTQHDDLQHDLTHVIDPVSMADIAKEIDHVKFKLEIKQDQINRVISLQRKKNFWKEKVVKVTEYCSRDLNNHYKSVPVLNKKVERTQTRSTSSLIPLTNLDKEVQILTTITTKGAADIS
ncbi:hypothetical protein HELRODRAFT_169349 [Helobdella robusta]|uniref:Cep57 centrosome localisation domain-containing protein n=1 Tax=Helobdella robusta TaxID=6412 RepID=T1F1T5_HELRO|nr:hypothetical protein HELRODRAFT_169349 [Helobdella robusta]ESO08493.1 hypothetical protein HELRODRAFT_169349 [Helobdella robusta]